MAVLDFFLAHRTSSIAIWACRLRGASTTKNVEKNGAKQLNEDFIGLQGGFSPLAKTHSGETNDYCKNLKSCLVSPQPACFYITGDRAFNFGFHSPTWIGFWLISPILHISIKFSKFFLCSPMRKTYFLSFFNY